VLWVGSCAGSRQRATCYLRSRAEGARHRRAQGARIDGAALFQLGRRSFAAATIISKVAADPAWRDGAAPSVRRRVWQRSWERSRESEVEQAAGRSLSVARPARLAAAYLCLSGARHTDEERTRDHPLPEGHPSYILQSSYP
jgi:hypothetical protein